MNFQGSDILSTKQFTREDVERLFETAKYFEPVAVREREDPLLRGKILANLFYEPSTRTRFSFEVAMKRLGGEVITALSFEHSSLRKGETLYDTGRVVSQFADVIVMRHPEPGSVLELAKGATIPVINAGDGPVNHPTQGLLDFYTIQKQLGRLDSLTITMVGDLKNSRVQHSQCDLFLNFKDLRFIFVSAPNLKMPPEILETLRKKGFGVEETDDLATAVSECDVLSSSRIQQERFSSMEEYRKSTGIFVIDSNVMKHARQSMILIAPLPRVEEITRDVDEDLRAKYFEQVRNGVPVRMALLSFLLLGENFRH